MYLINRFPFLVLLCLFFTFQVHAQKAPVRKIGIDQGLSNNAVNCIFRDPYGFMWIGTYDGLNRYDGYNFKIYRNIWGNKQSLINNYIIALAGDENNLWIGTQKGLSRLNYGNALFSSIDYIPWHKRARQKITSDINNLVIGKSGIVYVATNDNGLLRYSDSQKACEQIALEGGITNYTVQGLAADKSGKIWLFIKDTGLCVYEPETKQIKVINNQLQRGSCLALDENKNICIGTENGLYIFNTDKQILNKSAYSLSSENITKITIAKNGDLWIATNGGGINIVHKGDRKITYLLPSESSGAIGSGAIFDIYEDGELRKWIATLRGGVNIIDNDGLKFKTVTHDPLSANSLINNFIISFCEDEQKNLWIGTDGGGLSYYNSKTNFYTNYTHQSGNTNSISSNFIVSILRDHRDNIWIATFSGGIDLFNKQTGQFKHYSCYNTAKKVVEKNLWKLYEDRQHNIWAGITKGGALYKYDEQADSFKLFDEKLTNIHTLYQDNQGVLWAADYTHLIKVDISHKKHTFIPIGFAIRSMLEDRKHRFWISTEGGGLLLFDRAKNTFTRYTENDGLPSNSLLNSLEDNQGRIWFSTYNGLSEFNPETRKFQNYDASDGLQSNQFNYNAAAKLSTGELLFGGIKGFNRFYPDSINSVSHQPKLRFTSFMVDNQPLESTPELSKGVPLVKLDQITIPYNQASIAISYSALEYSFPDKIQYAYYLEGWDHSWNVVGHLRTAYYSRLNEGSYLLKIRATGTDGVWSKNPLVIRLVILPPWYRTWWAFALYSLVIAVFIYRLWLYHTRQTKLKYEIEITNLKAERDKELNEKKLSFFTNISHEFRTPLTLIINPIKDLLQHSEQKDKNDLNTIYRNARRLLGLVDHLLMFRKAESENNSLKIVKLNFTLVCNDVYQCFVHQARTKNIAYQFNHPSEDIELYGDREKIEIVLFNLISNAIKFTPDNGKIDVDIRQDEDVVMLQVSDSGRGIAAGIGEKLFDKYYQIKDKSSLKTGFGIGLYLVKTFIESHHGQIAYTNNPEGGTSFLLKFQIGKLHFKADEIFEASDADQKHTSLLNQDLEIDELQPADDEGSNQLELLISDRQTVLIIDDNAQLRDYIAKIFRKNYKIYEAENGSTGLEMIKRYLPDIIISDINMDKLTGIDLCRTIKQDSSLSHIPVILITGDSTPELQLEGIEVGAVDFISKPFEKDLLIARVNGILKSKKELQNYFYNEITLKGNTRNISEKHKDFLYQCVSIIENYIIDKDFDVKTIADEMGMSYSSLFKKIKAITGQSVNSLVRFIRIRKAAELLINTNCNVNEAALNVGINDIKYFREHFIKLFGMKPSEFMKKHRSAFHNNYRVEDAMINSQRQI
ncbi:response regulator [Mucilaginibacter sp. SMC90]|uniref:hybrid sensor histidine kinase/response regulator transcription factor n=1 Tax=Mucilaginibacter sp. SMC90 TaxID=2929803 RepID=UPI001FB51450|nr:hybrid sensor histidine kinase/response regulator transcription factor [Mucilaginibacter sp. SMC90]UOE47795.1 response regulator [Mucilaginibacter sp. SMC90]